MGNLISKFKRSKDKRTETPARVVEPRREQAPTLSVSQAIQPVFLSAEDIKAKPPEAFPDSSKGRVAWSTLLSSGLTPSDTLTSGIATCPPSIGFLGHHRHEQAEIYFILEGEGLVKVDDTQQTVSKGALVFIPGNAEHGIRNLSETESLVWFYCFATDKFEDVVYKFSE